LDKHLDNQELDALLPSCNESGEVGVPEPAPDELRDAFHHVSLCPECSDKLSRYHQVLERRSLAANKRAAASEKCPEGYGIDWFEVAAGLWPEAKAAQLMMHAALCDHCGPELRAAAQLNQKATAEEEKVLLQLKRPWRPDRAGARLFHGWSMKWLVPALAVVVIAVAVSSIVLFPAGSISGPQFARLAVDAHRQHAKGQLALDLRSDSEQELNEWLRVNSEFSVSLPAAAPVPGERMPFHLEGARLVQVGNHRAAFIAYQEEGTTSEAMDSKPVSLMIIPASVVAASGGTEVVMSKLHFHYAMVEPYKVVTWSQHGLTYALVSQDAHSSQQSCMVCHSAMRDRVLSRAQEPPQVDVNAMEPRLQ